jgi:hypothetical protein
MREQRIGFILIQKELVESFTNKDLGKKSDFIFYIKIIYKSIYRTPATFW